MRKLARLLLIASPFHALASPIFSREMAVSGRRWTTYAMRFMFVMGVLGIVSVGFVGMAVNRFDDTTTGSIVSLTAFAPQLVIAIIWVAFASMLFLAPVLTSGAICDEKTGRTLPALLTTPLTTTQIVFGKLAARLAQLALLMLCLVPILLLLRVYGGFSLGLVLKGTCITLSAAFLGSSVALMFSIWHKRSWTAMIYAILLMAVYLGAPLAALAGLASGLFGQGTLAEWVTYALPITSPPIIMAFVMFPDGAPFTTGNAWMDYAWLWCSLFTLGVGWLIGLFASLVLRRVMLAEAHGLAAGTGGFLPGSGFKGRGKRKAKRPRRERTRSRNIGGRIDLPVLWRERRMPITRNRFTIISSALVALVTVGLLYFYGNFRDEDAHLVILNIGLILLLAMAASVTANSITTEREARSLDVLLTTPMTVRSILNQKFLGNFLRLLPGPTLLAGHFVYFGLRGFSDLWLAGHVFAVSAGYTALLVGSGLLWGTLLKRTVAASAANMCFALGLWLGLPIAMAIFGELLYGYDDNFFLGTLALSINPVYLLVNGVIHDFNRQAGSQVDFGMGYSEIPAAAYHAIVYGSSAVAFGVGVLFTQIASWRLRSSFRRSE